MDAKRRATVKAAWNPHWFEQNPSTVYNHNIARIACLLADVAYCAVDEDAPLDSDLANVYKSLGIAERTIRMHYALDYSDRVLGNDQCAYSFAHTALPGGGQLVFVTVRGTPLGEEEWLSNLNINNEKEFERQFHEGFDRAENTVLSDLIKYIDEQQINLDSARFLITGHSRGAAVSNLLGASFAEGGIADTSRVFVYTFASPNVTTLDEETVHSEKYSFIFNIVNAEDAVPSVPFNGVGGWHYKKFGRTLILPNAWNCGRPFFDNVIYPRMNAVHRQLLARDYIPFRTGPFVQIQLGTMLAKFNPDVQSFYKGILALHNKSESMIPFLFPDKEKAEAIRCGQKKGKKGKSISERITDKIDKDNDRIITTMLIAANNMHACETYLSFMLALEQDECYYTRGSIQLTLDGQPEAVITAKGGRKIVHIKEGRCRLFEFHYPLGVCNLGGHRFSIGLPIDEDFDVILTDTAVFASPLEFSVDYYDAEGLLIKRNTDQNLLPCRSVVYHFEAGRSTWQKGYIEADILQGEERRQALKTADIYGGLKRRLTFESDIDSDLNLGWGAAYGTDLLYGTALFRLPLDSHFMGTWELDAGIGSKLKLWRFIYLNSELLARNVFVPDSALRSDGKAYAFVPALRLSLAFQPYRRFQFFVAGTGSLHIDGFNDSAFTSHRVNMNPVVLNDSLGIVPTLSVGFRF